MPQRFEAQSGQQTFFESVADREVTIAGYTGLMKDLVQLCPVKDDTERMTTGAMDVFAAKAWVASGYELPEEYAYLAESPDAATKSQEAQRADKIREKKRSEKDATATKTEAQNDGNLEDQYSVLRKEEEQIIIADRAIVLATETPAHDQEISQMLHAPDRTQMEAVIRDYDELYQAELRRQTEQTALPEVSLPPLNLPQREEKLVVKPREALMHADVPTIQKIDKDESVVDITPVPSAEQANGRLIEADEDVPLVAVTEPESEIGWELPVVAEDPKEAVEELRQAEPPEITFDEEVAEFWQQFNVESQLEPLVESGSANNSTEDRSEFTPELFSVFSAEEAAELDERLGFDVDPAQEANDEHAEIIKTPAKADFIETVYLRIEAMQEEKVLEAQEALTELETVGELALQAAVLEIDDMAEPQELEAIKEELYEHVERLLVLMGREPDARMVSRFVERLILSEMKKLADTMLEPEDEGTHEHKISFARFIDDLALLDEKAALLARTLGQRTLVLARS